MLAEIRDGAVDAESAGSKVLILRRQRRLGFGDVSAPKGGHADEVKQVVDHPDRLDGFPPGQRIQSSIDADDLAGTAGVRRQRPDQHGLASACANADVPDRLF